MAWAALGVGVAVAAIVAAAKLQAWRFARQVEAEARALLSTPAEPPVALAPLEALPAPVRRYLEVSGAAARAPIRSVRLRHGGSFLPRVGGAPMPIRGVQVLTAAPPGFVWWGRIRAAPGVWIDGRDRAVAGEGRMLVRALSTFTLVDARGPELDQGALLRLLGEATWMPTLLRDPRFVTWTAVDDRSARATLRIGGREVSGTFRFGADGLPEAFSCERHRAVDGGYALTPFTGTTSDFRPVGGVRVPFRLAASWRLDAGPLEYARWEVEAVELDPADPW